MKAHEMPKSYTITLKDDVAKNIEKAAKRVFVEPEELILWFLLYCMKEQRFFPVYYKLRKKLQQTIGEGYNGSNTN